MLLHGLYCQARPTRLRNWLLTFDHCSISSADKRLPVPPVLGLRDDTGLLQFMLVRLSILFLNSAVSLPVAVVRCSALLKLSTCMGAAGAGAFT